MTTEQTAAAQLKNGIFERHAQTILLTVTTAFIIGCFSVMYNIDKSVTKMQEQNIDRTRRIDEVQQGMNDVKLELKDTKHAVQDVRERVIRVEIETKKNQ